MIALLLNEINANSFQRSRRPRGNLRQIAAVKFTEVRA